MAPLKEQPQWPSSRTLDSYLHSMFPGVGHVVNGVGHVVNTSGVNRAPATNNPQPVFTLNGEEGSSS